MEIKEIFVEDYERVVEIKFSTGMKGYIAVHNTNRGPSLGGIRMHPYSDEQSALKDVLRLAKAMTYKAAVALLNLGGGKSVIIGNPSTNKTLELLSEVGEAVNHLKGKYIAAEDVGTTEDDMVIIRKVTPYVVGLPLNKGGAGDPSPWTALGVFLGIKVSIKEVFGSSSLKGKKIAIQGIGKVGYALAERLVQEGAEIYVADTDSFKVEKAKKELGAIPVSPDKILFLEVDVLSPCALGGVITHRIIPELKCKIIAGGANNQLGEDEEKVMLCASLLQKRNILYAPDFVINAGGLINVSDELEPPPYNPERVKEKVNNIPFTLKEIFLRSKEEKISTFQAALDLARKRIEKVKAGK